MSLNTTNVTGSANTSLTYHVAAKNMSAPNSGFGIDPANNLGYGVGKIMRGAFDLLYQIWKKTWTEEPSSKELSVHKQEMIFTQGLKECVTWLDSALENVRKNPHDPNSLKRIESLAEHYAFYLKPQNKPELLAYQQKALQPLKEKISQLAHPQVRNALWQMLPIFIQDKDLIMTQSQEAKRALQQAQGWPATFDLTTLNGTNGFSVTGLAAGGYLGISVSTAGDLNGDGKTDLVIGAHYLSTVSLNAGAAYVLFSQMSGWPASFNLAALNGTNGFAIPGIAAGDALGISVSTAGDFNGDGKDDLVLGAYGTSGVGAAYVLFGQTGGWPASFNLAALNGTNGFTVPGIAANGELGYSVSTAGDLNGDGLDDLILGAAGVSSSIGAGYVLLGQASGWPASFDLMTLNGTNGFAIPGIAASGQLGDSVSTAGDLNSDGRDDLVLGAYIASSYAGAAYVLFGQASGWQASFDLTTLNGTNGFAISGIAANDVLGSSVSTAGDLNGDGKDDLVLGAWGVSSEHGAAYVIFGQAGGWSASFNLMTLNGTNGFVIPGIAASGWLGSSCSTAGDLNSDGLDDLILGAYGVSSGSLTNNGAAYVVFGQASGWPASFNLASLNGTNGFAVPGFAANGYLGRSVSSAGDLNGDGVTDLVFGADGVSSDTGATYVIFGSNTAQVAPSSALSPIMIPAPTSSTSKIQNSPSFTFTAVPISVSSTSITQSSPSSIADSSSVGTLCSSFDSDCQTLTWGVLGSGLALLFGIPGLIITIYSVKKSSDAAKTRSKHQDLARYTRRALIGKNIIIEKIDDFDSTVGTRFVKFCNETIQPVLLKSSNKSQPIDTDDITINELESMADLFARVIAKEVGYKTIESKASCCRNSRTVDLTHITKKKDTIITSIKTLNDKEAKTMKVVEKVSDQDSV